MNIQLTVEQGEFTLQRLPRRRRELLQAWDAADEYLLNILAEDSHPDEGDRILILNDSFGALAIALNRFYPQSMSDSWLSQEATRLNCQANGIPVANIHLLTSLELPQGPLDWVLIKVPKTLALLHEQLIRLQPYISAKTRVIAASMVKNLSPSVWKLLENQLGPTSSSLAKKKARLIFVSPERERQLEDSPFPVCYQLEQTEYSICNHANVFSRERLDIGTRFFLQHLPQRPEAKDIVDLGCGNGVLGLMAALKHPDARLHFVDESFMAIDSARDNFCRALGDTHRACFEVGDGLKAFDGNGADLILCNPPFHQQHVVGDQIALSMFREAKRVLRPGGELWVIGNRHLAYHLSLKKIFGNVAVKASNKKFVILMAST